MKKLVLSMMCGACICALSFGQSKKAQPLFSADLSNADYDKSVWSVDTKGVLSASADKPIWTKDEYENFELTLEFKNDHCTNSGVFIYGSDSRNRAANSMEVQIADDYCPKWPDWHANWRCGAIFGHLAPSQPNVVKKPGKWNQMKITAKGKKVVVVLNGKQIIDMDMNLWTSGTVNPDGSAIPSWLPRPYAELPTKGQIGFQGKHGGATIWFRNIKIREL